MKTDPITNKRLFDLVRYQRSELLEAGLITEDEYSYILSDAPLAKGSGSPSPRRLEDYDEIRAKMDEMGAALKRIEDLADGWDKDGATGPKPPLSWESVARMAMDYARAAISKATPKP